MVLETLRHSPIKKRKIVNGSLTFQKIYMLPLHLKVRINMIPRLTPMVLQPPRLLIGIPQSLSLNEMKSFKQTKQHHFLTIKNCECWRGGRKLRGV